MDTSPLARPETLLPLLVGLTCACVQDIRERRISNVTNVVLAAAGVVSWLLTQELRGAIVSVAGCLAGLAIGAIAYRARWIGAGDAKLFAAVGAWTGPGLLLIVLLFTAVAGGFVSGVVLACAMRSGNTAMKVPYGVAIAFGTIGAVAMTQ